MKKSLLSSILNINSTVSFEHLSYKGNYHKSILFSLLLNLISDLLIL